jgi:hypothetical protein
MQNGTNHPIGFPCMVILIAVGFDPFFTRYFETIPEKCRIVYYLGFAVYPAIFDSF